MSNKSLIIYSIELCPKPPNIPFASDPVLSNGGITALYQCQSGYRIVGGNGATSRSVQCSTQSQFWPNLPSCERKLFQTDNWWIKLLLQVFAKKL